ncbi:MAG TPA: FdhF/YdeP family oxidoreductase [Myxococcota bacterium]|jgi:molybdopterin-dependent oxidoreductase alpha subunit
MARHDDEAAGGLDSILHTARHALGAGLGRALPALRVLNQPDGFDCPGCAWPEAAQHGRIEFCENGAKAVSHEATQKRVTRDFFLTHSLSALRSESHRELEAHGRLTEPMIRRPGTERFVPISWHLAFQRVGEALRALGSPNEAVFYTSGRTSNEAAFLYQLFVRELGTNNLPDCSNLCHESSGAGLGEMIGIGKGTVSLADFALADLILVIGQNPGSNHPRMLTTLEAAARRGCRIVSINPLRERGLVRFKHPQRVTGLLGAGTPLAERFVQVRVGGDVALLKGVMKELLALEVERPGQVLDAAFLAEHTLGLGALRASLEAQPLGELEREAGVPRATMRELAELYATSERTIACWAMGLTQHRHGVENVQELMNLLLLRGNLGRPGAGPCPVRGHSNVQGDRTMGIWERPSEAFLAALEREFGFAPPRAHGFSTIEAIHALHEGRAKFFLALGGNFAAASPDTAFTEEALGRAELAVHVATTLNRTQLVSGRETLLLPCLSRSERDLQHAGPQFVTVEDSMATVHRSQGTLPPASAELRSEVAIVAGIARSTLREQSAVPWEQLANDYDEVRERIARVVPGCERMNERVREAGGFVLPRGPAQRRFATPSGKAELRVVPLPRLEVAPGRLVLMTIRSHDQFNTTVYSDDDRYRGIVGDRRVVLANREDLAALGLVPDQRVDVTSHWADARVEQRRTLAGFRVVPYDVPRGCVAAYFPEANPLVPIGQFAERSLTPAFKSIVVTLTPAA